MNIASVKISKFSSLNILHVLNDGFYVSLPLLLPFIKNDMHLSLTQVGFLGSVMSFLAVLMALPAGVVAARWGGLKSLTWAIILYSLGFFAVAVAPNYWLIISAFVVAGTGFGIFHPIAFASIAAWTTKAERGRAMGNFAAIGDLGRVGISAGVTVLAAYIGWRVTSGIYGAVALSIFFLFLILKPHDETYVSGKKTEVASLSYLLKHKSFLLTTLTGSLDSFASSSIFVFIPFLLLSKGVEPATLGSFTAFYFVGNFIGKTMLGRFVDSHGNSKVFVIAEALMALNILLLALLQNHIAIMVVAVILGALTKGTMPVVQTMVAEATEQEKSYERVFGLNALLVGIATTIAPICYGLVADKFGIVNVFTLSSAIALMAIASALLLHRVKKHTVL